MKKKFSSAWLDVSISKNTRLQELFTGYWDQGRFYFLVLRFFAKSVHASLASGCSNNS